MKNRLEPLFLQSYKPFYIGDTFKVTKGEIAQSGTDLMNAISAQILSVNHPLDQQMDTEESYAYDASLCRSESLLLNRAFNQQYYVNADLFRSW